MTARAPDGTPLEDILAENKELKAEIQRLWRHIRNIQHTAHDMSLTRAQVRGAITTYIHSIDR